MVDLHLYKQGRSELALLARIDVVKNTVHSIDDERNTPKFIVDGQRAFSLMKDHVHVVIRVKA